MAESDEKFVVYLRLLEERVKFLEDKVGITDADRVVIWKRAQGE